MTALAIIGGCALISVALMGAGAFAVVGPLREAQRRSEALQQKAETTLDVSRLESALARIARDGDEAAALAERARAATERLAFSIRALRIPEAITALRVASAAIRALRAAVS